MKKRLLQAPFEIPAGELLTEPSEYLRLPDGVLIHCHMLEFAQVHDRDVRAEARKEVEANYQKLIPQPKSKSAEVIAHVKTFYTYEDAANYLGRSKAAIKQYVHRGKLDSFNCLGRKGFLKSDLDKLIQAAANSTGRRS